MKSVKDQIPYKYQWRRTMEWIKEKEKEWVVSYNADDEEPSCTRCEHINASEKYCNECIECGWSHYYREDTIKK